MELIELQSKDELNSFVTRQADSRGAEFLQSWFWGELEIKAGASVKRLAVYETGQGGRILAVATMIRKKLSAGLFYWYAPRGPLGEAAAVEFLIKEVKRTANRAVFLRFEPTTDVTLTGLAVKKTLDLQPKQSLLVDLNDSAEEILASMHQKTRYNIRLAEKKGVTIVEGQTSGMAEAASADKKEDFEEFWRLMSLTGERDAFRLHGREHYQNLLMSTNIKLFFARHEGKNIAAGIFCFFGNKVTYLHGASDNNSRNLMAPYLLQWEMIEKAKAAGYKYYDFYGLDEKKWPGVTRFKLGFGGRTIGYPGTFDAVFSPVLYNLYNFLRRLRRGKIG